MDPKLGLTLSIIQSGLASHVGSIHGLDGSRNSNWRNLQVTNARFVLAVLDLKRSTDYYTSKLGMVIDFEVPG